VDRGQVGVQAGELRVAVGDRGSVGDVHQIGGAARQPLHGNGALASAVRVALQRRREIGCRGGIGQAVSEDDRILDCLVGALPLMGHHRVSRIADQHDPVGVPALERL
jgi:hypothetical protein